MVGDCPKQCKGLGSTLASSLLMPCPPPNPDKHTVTTEKHPLGKKTAPEQEAAIQGIHGFSAYKKLDI